MGTQTKWPTEVSGATLDLASSIMKCLQLGANFEKSDGPLEKSVKMTWERIAELIQWKINKGEMTIFPTTTKKGV